MLKGLSSVLTAGAGACLRVGWICCVVVVQVGGGSGVGIAAGGGSRTMVC